MSERTDRVHRLAALVGGGALQVEDVRDGWPALALLHADGPPAPLALFVSPVGLSDRGRDDVERRFQNPGSDKPLLGVPGRRSVLVGLWEDDQLVPVPRPVVVTADAVRREGLLTRWSAFAPLATLRESLDVGWATHVSTSARAHPVPAPGAAPGRPGRRPGRSRAVGAARPDRGRGVRPAGRPRCRTRRPGRRAGAPRRHVPRQGRPLLRPCPARVRPPMRRVRPRLGLVQGAHIYPASAQGSPDEPWNGLALCPNHHAAFDRHLVAVRPDTLEVLLHEAVLLDAVTDLAARALVEGTLKVLRLSRPGAAPSPAMLAKRYAHYADKYGWLPTAWPPAT